MSHTPPTIAPLLTALLRLQALGPKNASHNVRKIIADLQKQRLLDILLHLAQHGPRDPGQGICLNAGRLAKEQTADGLRTMQVILSKLIARWPDNRDNAYPVEGSALAYMQAGSNKWQDPRRIALLDWLIEELQKDVRTTTQDA